MTEERTTRTADEGTVRAVTRALRILQEVGPHGANLTELADRVELPIPTVLRLIRTLEVNGFLERREDNYFLGPGVLQLAAMTQPDRALDWAVKLATERLRNEIGETACTYVREGAECVAVAIAQTDREVRWVPTMGERFPVSWGGPGDVLLAFGPTEELLTVLRTRNRRRGLAKGHPQWSDVDRLQTVAGQTRDRGYAINSRERLEGRYRDRASDVWGISVPMFASSGTLVGALAFCAPSARAEREREAEFASVASRIADAVRDGRPQRHG